MVGFLGGGGGGALAPLGGTGVGGCALGFGGGGAGGGGFLALITSVGGCKAAAAPAAHSLPIVRTLGLSHETLQISVK